MARIRLLGRCPNCSENDTIKEPENKPSFSSVVICDACGQQWQDWGGLISKENNQGNILTPFMLWHRWGIVELWWPTLRNIAHERLIRGVFNEALRLRFKAGVCMACEGGIQGIINIKGLGRDIVEFRNCYDKIGLYDEYILEHLSSPIRDFILTWYADLLRILGEEELMIANEQLPRGAIFRLSASDVEMAFAILATVLRKKTGSRGFAKAVLLKYYQDMRQNPFIARYLAGLTDEDIARIFVPPPGL